MIRWDCRQCGEPLEAPETLAATSLDCPKCGTSGRVPGPARGIGTRHWRRRRRIRRIGVGVFFSVIALGWFLQDTPRGRTLPEQREPLTMLRASRILEMNGWVFVSDEPYGRRLHIVNYEHGAGELRAGAELTEDPDALFWVSLSCGRPESSKALEFLCREMVRLIPDSAEVLVRLLLELDEAPLEGLIPHKAAIATTGSGWRLVIMDYRRTDALFRDGQHPLLYLDASR